MQKRVVITGLGPVTPIGIGKKAYWESLVAGESGAKTFISRDGKWINTLAKWPAPLMILR